MKILNRNIFAVLALSFVAASAAHADDSKITTKINAFGSAYYGQAFSKDTTPYGFSASNTAINNKADFTNFSLIGADISAKFTDEWSAAAEVIASGQQGVTSNYQGFAQWAFVTYKPSENTSARVGRQRFPIFTASEFINNHAELPYREIPSIVYKIAPFSTFDGASAQQVFDLGSTKLSVGIFGGTPLLDYSVPAFITSTFDSLIGAKLTLDGDGWRARLQGSTYAAHFDENFALIAPGAPDMKMEGVSQVYSAGYRYDKGGLVSWGEYVVSRCPNGTVVPKTAFTPGGIFADNSEAGYVLLGYRIGNFLPRYTFASAQQTLAISVPGQVTSHTIGVNYTFLDGVVGKLEYEYDKLRDAQQGVVITQSATSTANNTSAIFAGVDFKF